MTHDLGNSDTFSVVLFSVCLLYLYHSCQYLGKSSYVLTESALCRKDNVPSFKKKKDLYMCIIIERERNSISCTDIHNY